MKRLLLSALFCLLASVAATAQKATFDPTHFSRQAGALQLGLTPACYDSYLSPNNFSGLGLGFATESWSQSRLSDNLFVQQTDVLMADVAMHGAATEFGGYDRYTCSFAFSLAQRGHFRFFLGPQVQARLGAIYNVQNSNNPVAVHLAANVGAMAIVEFNAHTLLFHLPIRAFAQADVPLIGTFFAPEYTQSYYEIFSLHHWDHLFHLATPVTYFTRSSNIGCDFTLRHSILRLQFSSEVCQWHTATNNSCLVHSTVGIGFVRNLYSVHPHEEVVRSLPY